MVVVCVRVIIVDVWLMPMCDVLCVVCVVVCLRVYDGMYVFAVCVLCVVVPCCV